MHFVILERGEKTELQNLTPGRRYDHFRDFSGLFWAIFGHFGDEKSKFLANAGEFAEMTWQPKRYIL